MSSFLAVDNPVMRAEFKHQRHVITSSRSGRLWILLAMLMLLPGILASILLVGALLLQVDPDPIFTPQPWRTLAEIGVSSMVVMSFAMYIVVTLVTLALAASSISREQTARTWDNLLLTNMTARQIVQGKWWATLRALWGDHLLVLVLRLGSVVWLDFNMSAPDLPDPGRSLVGLLVVAAFTVADSALTVIMGILPPVSGRNPVVMAVVLGLRLVVSVAIVALSIGVGVLVHEWNPMLVTGVIVGMGIYVLVTLGMLRFAEWAAVRNLVSSAKPPE